MIGVFKKNISYQSGCIIYNIYSGEHREYDFLKQYFPNHILKCYIKDGIIELFHATQKQEEVDIQEPIFETMYKTTQTIQDKDGIEIEVGTQLTKEELKDKGFTKKKVEALFNEQKLMEIKVIK